MLDGIEDDIVIKLNTQGGDVFEGIEIYNYLKSLENSITIEVTALAASAGSIIAMGADKVIMDTGSTMMLHEASTVTWGNKADIQKTLNSLETIDESLINIYAERTGKTTEEVEKWLSNETWFTADEAVEAGLADEAFKPEPPSNEIPQEIIDEAVKRYFATTNAPTQPEPISGLNKLFKKGNK